jgi:predicted Zn-dependent protease
LDQLVSLIANKSIPGQQNPTEIGVLGLQSMRPRTFRIVVYFVGIGNPDPANTDLPTAIPNMAKKKLDWLLAEINSIWQPQANVTFTIALPQFNAQLKRYEVRKSQYDANVPASVKGTLNVQNEQTILSDIPVANASDVNVYFVKSFDPARTTGRIRGDTPSFQHNVFIPDAAAQSDHFLAQIIAHEIGHALGLRHNSSANAAHTACDQHDPSDPDTFNHFIDFAHGDTDIADVTSLMYCGTGEKRRHIGAPLWFQLNENNQ